LFKRTHPDPAVPAVAEGSDAPQEPDAAELAAGPKAAIETAPADGANEPKRSRRSRAERRQSSRARDRPLIGLDIEPGLLVAVKSRLDGHVVVERAAYAPIGLDIVRDGEVNNVEELATALRELFKTSGLDRRVRIGIANQRIMMRRIELPPLTEANEIDQAVRFQAQDELPMPLESVVLDYRSLGILDGEAGPRLNVLLVAARRDMVERVLQASRLAGLQPEGIDLAAFGMVRALRPADGGAREQILYLSIGAFTNLAISHGSTCEFTRVIAAGVEQIAANVASRCAITLVEARTLLSSVGAESVAPVAPAPQPAQALAQDPSSAVSGHLESEPESIAEPAAPSDPPTIEFDSVLPAPPSSSIDPEPSVAQEPSTRSEFEPSPPQTPPTREFGSEPLPPPSTSIEFQPSPPPPIVVNPTPAPAMPTIGMAPTVAAALVTDPDQIARVALAEGIRRIADEVRNSLDFYLASQGDEPLTRGVLCGPALDIPGFEVALSRELGIQLLRGEVALASPDAAGDVPLSLLAVAAGLSVTEGPQ
jgi:type IV pilus assembly protein PilM